MKNKKSECENSLLFWGIKQLDISFNFNLLRKCDSPIDACPLANEPHQNRVPQGHSKAHVHGEDSECEVEVVAGCGIGLDDEALAGRGVEEQAWLDEGEDLACDVCGRPDPDCFQGVVDLPLEEGLISLGNFIILIGKQTAAGSGLSDTGVLLDFLALFSLIFVEDEEEEDAHGCA